MLIMQSFSFNSCLTKFTLFPFSFRSFVTANVKVFRWKKLNNFINNIFYKFESFLFTSTINISLNSPHISNFKRTACTRILRISRECSKCMPWQFYFRNNINVSFCSVGNNLFNLFLRIKTTVFFAFINTFRSDFSKFRIFFNFNSPALIFC